MSDSSPALPPDLRASPRDLSTSDLCHRAAVAVAAGRHAETLAGGALEQLAAAAPAAGTLPVGFAEIHAGLASSEAAALRVSARLTALMPALAEARADGTLDESAFRQLRAVATPRTVDAWLEHARTEPLDVFRARLGVAREGDAPERLAPADATVRDGPLPSGAWRIACAVPFTAEQHDTWWRASQHLRVRAMKTLTTAEVVERLVTMLAQALEPTTFEALTPRRTWHVDPLRQVAWLQTGAGRLQVPLDAVPAPAAPGAPAMSGPSVQVLRADGTPVPLLPESLLAAFPELRGSRWTPSDVPEAVPVSEIPRAPADPGVRNLAGAAGGAALWPPPGATASFVVPVSPAAPVSTIPRVPDSASARNLAAAEAASASRVSHILRSVLVDSLTELSHRVSCGELAASDLDSLRLRLGSSPRDLREALHVGRALRNLPALHAAFAAGRASYTKLRAAVRSATSATDAAWAELVVNEDTAAIEAFAEATPRGTPPPRTAPGMPPLRPIGALIRERIHVVLDGTAGETMRRLREFVDKLAGRPLDTAEALAALAGWYLAVYAPTRRDTVVYQRSPESRVPGRPDDLLSPTLMTLKSVSDRVRAAFPHAARALADPVKARRAWARLERLLTPGEARPSERRRVSVPIRDAVRRRDGERCIIPGCGNSLVVQHDHGTPVAQGGTANVVYDHRLCGPCNRAKHRGEIQVFSRPDGGVYVADGDGRPLRSGAPIGQHLDATMLARCWAAGEAEVARMTLKSVPARSADAPEPVATG